MSEQRDVSSDLNQDGKSVAIISYITFIGWIVALLIHSGNKTQLGAFHLRQSLGIMILALAALVVNFPLSFVPYLGWMSGLLINVVLVVLWVMGLISAVQAEEKPVPFIGEHFQKWFGQLN